MWGCLPRTEIGKVFLVRSESRRVDGFAYNPPLRFPRSSRGRRKPWIFRLELTLTVRLPVLTYPLDGVGVEFPVPYFWSYQFGLLLLVL